MPPLTPAQQWSRGRLEAPALRLLHRALVASVGASEPLLRYQVQDALALLGRRLFADAADAAS